MIYYDLPMDEYLSNPAIGSSTLKNILSSPLDFKTAIDTPFTGTRSTLLGSATHTAILEPHTFDDLYLIQTEDWGPRNKGEGKKKWDALKKKGIDENKGVLSYEEGIFLSRSKKTSLENSLLAGILKEASIEVTSTCSHNGIDYKARPDVTSKGLINWDLKTTSKPIDEQSLQRTIYNNGYHFQAAHHIFCQKQNDIEIKGWGWIFVSTATPHPHIVLRLASESLLEAGKNGS